MIWGENPLFLGNIQIKSHPSAPRCERLLGASAVSKSPSPVSTGTIGWGTQKGSGWEKFMPWVHNKGKVREVGIRTYIIDPWMDLFFEYFMG